MHQKVAKCWKIFRPMDARCVCLGYICLVRIDVCSLVGALGVCAVVPRMCAQLPRISVPSCLECVPSCLGFVCLRALNVCALVLGRALDVFALVVGRALVLG